MTQNSLTKAQNTASLHYLGPALTLAIPGSGKTTLLIHRLIHLVEIHHISPDSILTLTFSKASADDMAKRYKDKFGYTNYQFKFMTIHKLAYSLYKSYLKSIDKQMSLLDDGSQKYQILNDIYKKRHHEALNEDDFETLSNQIGLIYNLMLKRDDLGGQTFDFDDIFDLAEEYHRYKRKHHLYDFDDMLISAIQILKKSPLLQANLKSKYRFIQVDEAQDTSKLQFEFIELLLGDERNLFLVADDDQSIYGFRGAYPTYLLEFPSKSPNAKLYYLSDNFRSDANIVSTAAKLIEGNKHRFKKDMVAFHAAEIKPKIQVFDDLDKRNSYLINQITAPLIEENTGITRAILYRNKVSAISIVDMLERNQKSFQIKDAPLREFNHWLLEDLIAFMTLAMIPQDLESFNRIAFKMNGFISREMLNYVKLNHRGRSVFSVLVEIPFLQDYQTKTQERLYDQFEQLKQLRPYDAIHYIETELGYLDYLKNNTSRLGLTMNYARTRLDAYKAIAKPLKSGFDFMTRISKLKEFLQNNFANSNEAIVLSTIHGSKGLEFDEVYMIDVNPQIFPGFKAKENDALEEERRLFYVGLTRAKRKFELLHSEFINGSYNGNSLFIDELINQSLTECCFNNVMGKPATC
ncbi:ATP-dependent helicase [Fusibacter bizertensis]